MQHDNPDHPANRSGGRPSLLQVFGSVLASMFGVQSGRRHAQDFAHGRPWVYVVVGLIATVLFVMTVWLVVRTVLRAAGV